MQILLTSVRERPVYTNPCRADLLNDVDIELQTTKMSDVELGA
jgi:hypothetical protein